MVNALVAYKDNYGYLHNPNVYIFADKTQYIIKINLNVNASIILVFLDKMFANIAHHKKLSLTIIVFRVQLINIMILNYVNVYANNNFTYKKMEFVTLNVQITNILIKRL